MQKGHGKKYREAAKFVDMSKIYEVAEAVELLEKTNFVKFDPSIEVHFRMGINTEKNEQHVRATISLPHGTGKSVRIAAFTDGGNEKELMSAGAVLAGGDDLIEQIVSGAQGTNFDVAIATTGMMRKMSKAAKVLGPKGLMPSPKSGTVGDDLVAIMKELKGGRFEFKTDKQGNIHAVIGKLSFGSKKLGENLAFFIQAVKDAKPSAVKSLIGFIEAIYICSAMGPSIRVKGA